MLRHYTEVIFKMTASEYNECVKLHADGLYRFILKRLGKPTDAKDVVQVAYEKLWVHHHNVDFMKAKSYLFKAGYTSMVDGIRKMKRLDFVGEVPETATRASNNAFEARDLMEKASEYLPDVQKTVLMLRDYEGYSYEEIGEITGLNEPQVKVYIFRARKKLQELIGSHEINLANLT